MAEIKYLAKSEAKKNDWTTPAYRRKVLAARAKTLDRKMKARLIALSTKHTQEEGETAPP